MMACSWLVCSCVFSLFLLSFSTSADDVNSQVWEEGGINKFGIAEAELEDKPLDVDTSSKLQFQYQTNDGRKIFVYDKLVNSSLLQKLNMYTNMDLGAWKFNLYEPYEELNKEPRDNVPWVNRMNCLELGQSLVGRVIQKAVMDSAGTKQMYYPYQANGKIVRRGDYTKLFIDAKKEDEEFSVVVFMNRKWQKNDYGELYLFDDDKEITAGAVPRYGRIVIFPSSVTYLHRPPGVSFKKGQQLLHIKFTKSKDKVMESHQKWKAYKQEVDAAHAADFVGSDKALPGKLDIGSYKVAEHQSLTGKKIFVFDGLFEQEDLDKLRSVILKYGIYYYDDSEDDTSDNVQWIAGFPVDSYIKSRIWNITHQVATYSSGTDKWFPYDVSCNLLRNADHARIHHDNDEREDEWTFLVYLTPNWTINDYGETAFYERNSDDTEIIAEVRPKYGRAVIFQGIIPHSGRPPSTNFSYARLSFAVKMSVNETVGRTKAFTEEMRHYQAVRAQLNFLQQDYQGTFVRRVPPQAKKYPSADETSQDNGGQVEEEEEDDEPPDSEGPEQDPGEGPNANDISVNQMYAEDDGGEDEMMNDPEIRNLYEKLEAAKENPETATENIRVVHKELTEKHIHDRLVAREVIAKQI